MGTTGPTCPAWSVALLALIGLAALPLVTPALAETAPEAPVAKRDANAPKFAPAAVALNGKPAATSGTVGSLALLTVDDDGPQAAITLSPSAAVWVADIRPGEQFTLTVPVTGLKVPIVVSAEATLLDGPAATAELSAGACRTAKALSPGRTGSLELRLADSAGEEAMHICLAVRAAQADSGRKVSAVVRCRRLRVRDAGEPGGRQINVQIALPAAPKAADPPPALPAPRPGIQGEMIEADWRMQDGIGTARLAVTYAQAVERILRQGGELIDDLRAGGSDGPAADGLAAAAGRWEQLRRQFQELSRADGVAADDDRWENLWRQVHRLRRQIALNNPLARVAPVAFVKRLPATFSHQLTQYYGRYSRPGGGLFVLDDPGESMACRQLAPGALGVGSYQQFDVSCDGKRVLFTFCSSEPKSPRSRFYHLYSMAVDGTNVRQLTDGPYDDFSPRWLPNGQIVFLSTRRGGFHRCGSPGCPVYTLAVANADGSGIRQISHHETQEWDPAVLHDGRIIYTRWDYVDRHAVFGEHLWTTRPDGTAPAAFYGNMTRNPVGTWEPQPIPGSRKVMATAAAHHAMTTGSIVLVDVDRGYDGLDPLTRLTPDVPFPESEFAVKQWFNPSGVQASRPDPPENQRWPGHSYRTAWPLSEKYFLGAYSFDPLVGEPLGNQSNMFGLYLVDAFGNKELLYRDMSICSLWPTPLRARPCPPALPAQCDPSAKPEGTFVVQDVYAGWPVLPAGSVQRLRITQVLPKSTEGRDRPPMGLAGGSPGKQVLGTVPVEADGSACFVAPAGIPLLFQALDDRGQAVQIMRSATYLQPGEQASCVGCHEPRTLTSRSRSVPAALRRAPSRIEPGPEGSKPLSYPLLVQPVLDKHCVRCHSGDKPPKGIVLTGAAAGHYTASYNALAPRVPSSNDTNSEPLSRPDRYGARGSSLMKMLLKGHNKVVLSPAEIERLATWMDTNALFYGTFDPAGQARQQRGEKIAGPGLQ